MPSKGITSYGYVASSTVPNVQLQVLVPSANYSYIVKCSQGVKQDFGNWAVQPFLLRSGNAQIYLTDICYATPDTPGTVTFQTVNLPGNFSYFTQIYPITGEIGNSSAVTMLNTPAIVTPEWVISWGLYRAGPGNFGLTNQYQQYLYLTDNHSRWMGDLVQSDPAFGQQAFNRFVLPGAHDAGMFDPTWINNNLNALDQSLSQILNQMMGSVFGGLISNVLSAIGGYVPRFVEYLAFTQKENVLIMLNLGVRYFDFRPGKVAAAIQKYLPQDNTLYHQHSFIPGYPYISFLTDVLNWLNNNPTEIVVISLCTNGFYDHSSMDPTIAELKSAWAAAVSNSGSTLVIGTNADLSSSYNSLIAQQKRVIFLNNTNIGAGYYNAAKYDTYDGNDDYYATFDPGTIVNNVLANMNTQDQANMDYTVVQVQGTCTAALQTNVENEWNNNKPACISDITQLVAACTDSQAASFLMSTKALFDQATYPWVYQNLNGHLLNDQLTVVLNDFADNALADICKALTVARMQS